MKIDFQINSKLLQQFPDVAVAAFSVPDLSAAADAAALASQATEETLCSLQERFGNRDALQTEPRLACWREASRTCGLKASEYRSSPDQLARRYLSGRGVQTGLAVVDAYCAISARHLIPFGGYDAALLPHSEIRLRLAQPGVDRFLPLGSDHSSFPLKPQVAVYAAEHEVLCWHFNHRDSRLTSLREETREALFFAESIVPGNHPAMIEALCEWAAWLRLAGANPGEIRIADERHPHFELEVAHLNSGKTSANQTKAAPRGVAFCVETRC